MALEDVQMIMGLAVSKRYKPDSLIWHYTKFGKYTVKSGYWLAQFLEEKKS